MNPPPDHALLPLRRSHAGVGGSRRIRAASSPAPAAAEHEVCSEHQASAEQAQGELHARLRDDAHGGDHGDEEHDGQNRQVRVEPHLELQPLGSLALEPAPQLRDSDEQVHEQG